MSSEKPILFFDGHCNLCNGFIDFLVRRDPEHKINIASLQGETAEKLLAEADRKNLKSVVFYDSGRTYYKSSAIFKIAWLIGGRMMLLLPFWIVPRFFTNWVYDFVAMSRYKVFGRSDTCRIPTEEEKAHFLP